MQVLSLGAQLDVWTVQSGVVHSVFRRAINLLVNGELWSVLGAAGHDSPFGIRVAVGDRPGGFGVHIADRVQVRGGWVRIGDLVLDCRAAPRWLPVPWAEPAAGLAIRLGFVELAARERSWPGSAAMAADLGAALRATGSGRSAQLNAAVGRVVGRGPGLTPAGDDVLVGMLTVLGCGGGPIGRCCAGRLARALAPALPATNEISRHLLVQAARGLPGRALHELGRALFEDAPEDVVHSALARVLGIGATSGADACMGLLAAVQFLFLPAGRIAA